MSDLFKKLLIVQMALKAPKNQWNKFGKYYYRSCEDIVEAVKPILAENNLLLTISDELVQKGERYYIKATITITDTETGEKHEVYGYAREEENKKGMDSMQLTGATSSYARKYALNGMFAIDDTKDSDATNEHGKGSKPAPKKNYSKKTTTKKTTAKENTAKENTNKKDDAEGTCDSCGTSISEGNISYCQNNKEKFDGKNLCFKCQEES